MGFFDWLTGSPGEEPADRAARLDRQQQSYNALKAGGLPRNATERLREQAARQGTPGSCFSSNLSSNEFLLTQEAGFEPLGQVMGSSIFQIGVQWTNQNWRNSVMRGEGISYELTTQTQAFAGARLLALTRLAREAVILGATTVVGVRLKHESLPSNPHLLEFTALGTAIREKDVPLRADARPALCGLSGQEWWKLRQGGFKPVGLSVGNCVYCCIPNRKTVMATQAGWLGQGSSFNQELPDYTAGIYEAREIAMGRMESQARSVSAEGIMGVTYHVETEAVQESNRQASSNQPGPATWTAATRLTLIYHFTIIGTAVTKAPRAAPAPTLAMIPLRDSARMKSKPTPSRVTVRTVIAPH